eukprot:g2907.t1
MRSGYNSVVRFLDGAGNRRWGIPTDGTLQFARVIEADLFSDSTRRASVEANGNVEVVRKILPPLENEVPPAVFCIGLNYRKHAAETNMKIPRYPIVLMKNPAAVCAHLDEIEIPPCASDDIIDYEAELALVIGKETKNVSPDEALDYVLGYTTANDVSARKWQGKKGGGQWCRSKSFDTFLPLGPELLLDCENPNALDLRTRVNGVTLQDSNTSDMIFSVAEIVSFLSQGTTLLPGTVVLTGTPEGVGYTREPRIFLKKGDEVEVGLGDATPLQNRVAGPL